MLKVVALALSLACFTMANDETPTRGSETDDNVAVCNRITSQDDCLANACGSCSYVTATVSFLRQYYGNSLRAALYHPGFV